LHLRKTRKMGCGATSLPVLRHGGQIIQGSDAIIDYLDRIRPEPGLTPLDPQQAAEAREWELFLDREIGVHLRRYFYHYLLAQPAMAKRMILHNTSFSTRAIYAFAFPAIRRLMRRAMNIRPETAEKSRQRLLQAIDRLNDTLKNRSYLVGDRFSRADMSAAALLAPLCTPPEHSFPFPKEEEMPEVLRDFRAAHRQEPFFQWTLKLYREHRG
ncbi:MAG TPA: glutathione S-transferase family protein, partial [bacterium]|nr:glutathione S-transferase family protein [bacterium]